MATTAFEYFVGRDNQRMVYLLEQNESVSKFVQGLLDHLVSYCDREGVKFADLEIDMPYVANDEHIRGRIVRTR